MDKGQLQTINIVYVIFIVTIIILLIYYCGWKFALCIIFSFLFMLFLTTYIVYINMEYYESYQYNVDVNYRNFDDYKKEVLKPSEIHESIKKQNDIINNVDLSKSKIHDIDE